MVNAVHLAHPMRGQIHELFYPNDGDHAALATPGGIDLNSKNLKLSSEGQKVDISFNSAMVAQFKRGDFSGVRFQIFDVIPESMASLLVA